LCDRFAGLQYITQMDTHIREKPIHVYYGGSFSPPTIAHRDVGIDTIRFLLKNHSSIVFHYVPVSHTYGKASISVECIAEKQRMEMLKIMINSINPKLFGDEFQKYEMKKNTSRYSYKFLQNQKEIVRSVDYENYVVTFASHDKQVMICANDFEQSFTNGLGTNYIGTYEYLDNFSRTNGIDSPIYLLVGGDNAKGLLSGSWKKAVHLIAQYVLLVYPRSNDQFSTDLYMDWFSKNPKIIDLYTIPIDQQTIVDKILINELNPFVQPNGMIDLTKTEELKSFIIKHVMTIVIEEKTIDKDKLNIAEASSSSIRDLLYKNVYEGEPFQFIDREVLHYIQKNHLYNDLTKTYEQNKEIGEGMREKKVEIPTNVILVTSD